MRRLVLLLILATLAVSGGGAQADLLFRASWPASAQPAVRAEFQRYPERLQEKLKTTLLSFRVHALAGDIIGEYEDRYRLITLEDPRDLVTLDHEAGHAYYCIAMTAAERDEWGHFWNHHLADMPTSYARTNKFEGYAECYRAYFRGDHLRDGVRARLESFFR